MTKPLLLGLALLSLASAAAIGAPTSAIKPASDTPQVGEPSVPVILHPYNEEADAKAAVDSTLAAAKSSDKRTLIVFGANWCGDCKALAGILSLDPVKAWTDRHYQIVEVDVGRFNRNTDVAARFGIQLKAIPALVVVSPDGKIVNGDETLVLGDARKMSVQAVVDTLGRWVVEAPAS